MMLLPQYATRRDDDDISHLLNTIQHSDCMDLLARLPDASIDMVLCDLPYGQINYEWDEIIPLTPLWIELRRVVKERSATVLTASEPFASLLRINNLSGWRYDWVWEKSNATRFLDANRMPMLKHEMVLVFGDKLPNYYPQMAMGDPYVARNHGAVGYVFDEKLVRINSNNDGTRYPKTIIQFGMAQQDKIHVNQKPVALFEYLIKTYTQEHEIVLDMTCGSGTTAIAALKTNRQFICGDNHLPYVELARKRIADTDPYVATVNADGSKQLSLFEDVGA